MNKHPFCRKYSQKKTKIIKTVAVGTNRCSFEPEEILPVLLAFHPLS